MTRAASMARTADTMTLYEKEPAVKLGTSHLVSVQAGLTARRTD